MKNKNEQLIPLEFVTMISQNLGPIFKEIRETNNISITDAVRNVDFHRGNLTRFESGTQAINANTFIQLVKNIGCTKDQSPMNWFLDEMNSREIWVQPQQSDIIR